MVAGPARTERLHGKHVWDDDGVISACIVDVGCSWSATRTRGLRDHLRIPTIYIDPDVASLEKIPARDEDKKIGAAITTFDGECPFYFYADGTHSLLETNLGEVENFVDGHTGRPARKEDWAPRKVVQVPTYRLDTIIKELEIQSIVFLKIDAQGHDLEVLKSLGDCISSVQFFEVEVQVMDVELYHGSSRRSEVLEYAKSVGFELIHSESQTFGQEENLLFMNLRSTGTAENLLTSKQLIDILEESSQLEWSGESNSFMSRLRRLVHKVRK